MIPHHCIVIVRSVEGRTKIDHMKDGKKTKDQLIEELLSLRRRVADLEGSDAGGRSRPEVPSGLEERYRTLFEHASDAIIVADPEGNFLEVNRKAEDLLGYGKEELLRMKVTDIHPREELDRVVLHFSGAVAGRIGRASCRERVYHPV